MELQIVAVDDLIHALTRIAALADSACYALGRGKRVAFDARFEQIREEALEAIERAENGGL